jgi:hypothetical protein
MAIPYGIVHHGIFGAMAMYIILKREQKLNFKVTTIGVE